MSDVNQPEVPLPPTPESPPVPRAQSSAEQIISQAERTIVMTHDHVIGQIDDMILALQSVKQAVQIKKEGAVNVLKEFVHLAESGLNKVKSLQDDVERLVQNHLHQA